MKMTPLELALQSILFAPVVHDGATVLDVVQYYRNEQRNNTVELISWLIEAYPRRGLGYMKLNYLANNLPLLFPS